MAFNYLDPIIRIGKYLFYIKLLLIVIRPIKTLVSFKKMKKNGGKSSITGVKILYGSLPNPQYLAILLNNLAHFLKIYSHRVN